MRSSIGITKILTFYFILLYLFLKAKMCVGSARVSGNNDSDINYYDSDESFQSAPGLASAARDATQSPAGLVPYSAKSKSHKHGVTTPRPHHVRHENHYLKSRHITQAQQAVRVYQSNFKTMDSKVDRHHLHISHHRPHSHQQKVHHRGSKHNFRQQNHGESKHHFNPPGRSSFSALPVEGPRAVKLNRSNLSSSTSSPKQSKVRNEEWISSRSNPSTAAPSTVQPTPASIQNNNNAPSNQKRPSSISDSRNYFEQLLNNYKIHSPYYKEHLMKDSSHLTKSLITAKGKCIGPKCKHKFMGTETIYDEDEYEEDEDDDDDDDEDEDYEYADTQGDAGYSTTFNPIVESAIQEQHSREANRNQNSLRHDTPRVFVPYPKSTNQNLNRPYRSDTTEHDTPHSAASSHATKMIREGNCSVPKPKVIVASNDPRKHYTPHCTILHQCGDDVGCCQATETCAATKQSIVVLYFFVQTVGAKPSIEPLRFVNHTECGCVSRFDSIHRRQPQAIAAIIPTPGCTCPLLFQRVIDNDNRCFCDCSSSDAQCDQFKRGYEHFSMETRKCIREGRCKEPICEYGHYNKARGRCPTKEERISKDLKGLF